MNLNVGYFCKTLTCPKQVTTAKGRRKLLKVNENKYPLLLTKSNPIKITKEYVEKPNGDLLFTKLFEPKDTKKVKGMILYSMGFGSNADWFLNDVALKYAELGFIVFVVEWKGHGRSDGDYVIIEDFERDLVNDALWIFDRAIKKYIKPHPVYKNTIDKNKNYFLVGQSMGGAISILVALKQQKRSHNPYKGVIIISPMINVDPKRIPSKPIMWLLENCLIRICPYFKLIPNGVRDRKRPITNNPILLQKAFGNPVSCDDNLSLITVYNLYKTIKQIEARAKELKLPILIIHGDSDVVTCCQSSQKYFENCGSEDKEIIIYPGVGHLLYSEQPDTYDHQIEWMLKRVN